MQTTPRVVVLGLSYCPFTARTHRLLDSHDIAYQAVEIDCCKEELKRRHFFPTFPQVFIDGNLLGGFEQLHGLLADGFFAPDHAVKEIVDQRSVGYQAARIEVAEQVALLRRYKQHQSTKTQQRRFAERTAEYAQGPCPCVLI
mgnify:FL=1